MKVLLVIIQAILISSSMEATWLDRKAEGWAWYEDKIEKTDKELGPKIKQKTAQETIEEAKKLLEEKLSMALLNPTEQNLEGYMVEQKKWLQQSALFAHIWEKVLLKNPELDPTATSYPVTQYGIRLQREIDQENNRLFITQLTRENGLFFFYEGNSKISQGLAKVVKLFSEKYQWEVIPISVDGIILEDFSQSKLDNGITKQIGISIYPALFVINTKNKTATPIAYGFVTVDQIEDRVLLQFKEQEVIDD